MIVLLIMEFILIFMGNYYFCSIMGRILALDYGQKRVGIAVTDENQIIAGPLDTISSAVVLDFLAQYLQVNPVDCFVIGEPKQRDNSASPSEIFIEPFIRKLKARFPGIPVERVDERYTSKMAGAVIIQSGLKKKDRRDKSLVDKISAAIILQSYLDMRALKIPGDST